MRKMIVALAAVFAGFVFLEQAYAWTSAGHMVIAAAAFRELPPPAKFKVAELLQSHPEYPQWAKEFGAGRRDVDLQTYIFMRASMWPDEIHKTAELKYVHPHWHYIDYPLQAPSFPMEPAPAPEDDALYGIAQCEKVLADTNATPELKAVSFSYLIHLIGDIHDPLHCGTLIDSMFPKGDRDGNDFYVKPGEKGIRLHVFWDELLGTRPNTPEQYHRALKVLTDHSRGSLPELKDEKGPKDWSLESRMLAVNDVYLKGELKGSTHADNAPVLPPKYINAAEALAERQAALAVYRTCDEVQKALHDPVK